MPAMAAGAELAAALAAEPEPMVRVAMAAQSSGVAVLDLCKAHGSPFSAHLQ